MLLNSILSLSFINIYSQNVKTTLFNTLNKTDSLVYMHWLKDRYMQGNWTRSLMFLLLLYLAAVNQYFWFFLYKKFYFQKCIISYQNSKGETISPVCASAHVCIIQIKFIQMLWLSSVINLDRISGEGEQEFKWYMY